MRVMLHCIAIYLKKVVDIQPYQMLKMLSVLHHECALKRLFKTKRIDSLRPWLSNFHGKRGYIFILMNYELTE